MSVFSRRRDRAASGSSATSALGRGGAGHDGSPADHASRSTGHESAPPAGHGAPPAGHGAPPAGHDAPPAGHDAPSATSAPGARGEQRDPTGQHAAAASDGRAVAARVVGLTKTYGSGAAQVVALDDVTVELYAGEYTAIMGPSGSGKSTLMHCAAGLDSATSGEVFVGGTPLSSLNDKRLTELRRDRVGFVFQAFNLIPTLTAKENITLPLAIAGRTPDREWYRTVIDTVGLADRLNHKPSELSGGQQQRVACARALVSRPQVIFADEPTGNLDSRSSAEILAFLRRSVEEFGQTIVMVTHDPVAAAYTDRVLFLADGRIVAELRNPTREQVLAEMSRLDAEV